MKKLTIFCLFFSQMTFASFDMNEKIERSYFYIINLEFEKANILLDEELFKDSNNGLITLHKNFIDFLTIIITEDYDYFKSHQHLKKERLKFLEKNDQESPYYLYCKAEIYLQWAFSRLKFQQYSTAIYELITAYKLLEENKKKFPEFTLNYKPLGVLHTILGAIPDEFNWLLNIAGLKGSIDLGINELNIVLNDNKYIMYEQETLFLLSFLQMNLANNDSLCMTYLDRIGDRYQDNILLAFAAARLSNYLGHNDYCIEVLNNKNNNSKINFSYFHYLKGMSYLYKLDYSRAKHEFKTFLSDFKGKNYIKSAYHKLAWIAYLENDDDIKRDLFNSTITEGHNFIDEDKVAFIDASKQYISPKLLLKSRLLYDGGYYSLALDQLQDLEINYFSSNLDQMEYYYRLSRIQSKLNYSNEIIIENYNRVLTLNDRDINYYAPMSALQIALIYEQADDLKNAEIFFKKCLSMSGFDYERGIHQKAKAGLERIY